MHPLVAHASAALGLGSCRVVPLHGGDLSEVVRLIPDTGPSIVAKSSPLAEAEAQMLRALAAAGVPAPTVLHAAPDFLVMEDLGTDTGLGQAWGPLGTALAQLHATTGADYGWACDYAFGSVVIQNTATEDWPSFWAKRRLMPFVPHVPIAYARRIEDLCPRLPQFLPAHPPAALLHGDLWAGNVMAQGARVTGLIDPACYYGDAEVDLAMLCLFGHPTPAFWEAYGAPAPGFDARRALYQLFPALVHVRLFGAGYLSLVTRCLEAVDA
ncbi:fructosamine-3-kinase [Rhodobacter aestuarii]|uniref:Fructosamine-3-kinase n=1 Tax=Rhodobacter aestuarii TaxID=453582 RepID=A0A1N7LZI2_9RHOB|nr:fructosamine kinase family protein [Rhodobacter aestuarii]PTV94739.1 fructosamine-3-kinase [Rhodobacter aestuarii]SIS79223.1 Fructosamine-3-kinase [Rhodobacter aestuarii]